MNRTRLAIAAVCFGIALALFGGVLSLPVVGPAAVGACDIVIVRETADDTPAIGRLVVGLQSGEVAKYLESKGHELYLLDDDAKDAGDAKAAMLKSVEPAITGMTEPAFVMVDRSTKRIAHKESLPPEATAADVLALVKEHGG